MKKNDYEILDKNHKRLQEGDSVEAQYCTGRYGQTRRITGTVKEISRSCGVGFYITLDDNNAPFTEHHGRFPPTRHKPGDTIHVCGVLRFDHATGTYVGYGKHDDFEHGHEYWIEKTLPE